MSSSSKLAREYVTALEKGLFIIEAFGIRKQGLTISDAAKITGHTRASTRRALLTLQQLGYVESDGKVFYLAPRVMRLGHAYLTSTALAKVVQPVLEAASERTRESTSAVVLDGTDVVFIARAAARRSLSNGLGLGSRLPAYATATGRVLLSNMPDEQARICLARSSLNAITPLTCTEIEQLMRTVAQVRRLGYAINNEELELGVRSLAVPIQNSQNTVIGAMSIVTSAARHSPETLVERLLPELERSRAMLSILL